MIDTYRSKQPLALPSFYFSEIEKEAREKLKDRRGEPPAVSVRPYANRSCFLIDSGRCVPLRVRQRRELLS